MDYNYSTAPQRERTYRPQPAKNPGSVVKQKRRLKPAVGRGINFVSMMLLLTAMAATLFVCYTYLSVQADSTQLDKRIVSLESQLAKLNDRNNSIEVSLNQAVDLDEVYRIAVTELGMVHPNNNMKIEYESNDVGYVRQFENIPE